KPYQSKSCMILATFFWLSLLQHTFRRANYTNPITWSTSASGPFATARTRLPYVKELISVATTPPPADSSRLISVNEYGWGSFSRTGPNGSRQNHGVLIVGDLQ